MSRTYSVISDEHQKQLKTNFRTYFSNINEPQEHSPTGIPDEIEYELLENCGPMRQELRRLAQRMRNRNA